MVGCPSRALRTLLTRAVEDLCTKLLEKGTRFTTGITKTLIEIDVIHISASINVLRADTVTVTQDFCIATLKHALTLCTDPLGQTVGGFIEDGPGTLRMSFSAELVGEFIEDK